MSFTCLFPPVAEKRFLGHLSKVHFESHWFTQSPGSLSPDKHHLFVRIWGSSSHGGYDNASLRSLTILSTCRWVPTGQEPVLDPIHCQARLFKNFSLGPQMGFRLCSIKDNRYVFMALSNCINLAYCNIRNMHWKIVGETEK